jgi:hypothetical protein
VLIIISHAAPTYRGIHFYNHDRYGWNWKHHSIPQIEEKNEPDQQYNFYFLKKVILKIILNIN